MATLARHALALTVPRLGLVKSEADRLTAIYSAPPIPVHEIAEEQGVDVVFATFGEFGDRVAGFCDFDQGKLYVNAEDKFEGQTFTIAHELGHWILHRQFFEADPESYQILPRFQQTPTGDAFELEATLFAVNLLVPQWLLEPVKHATVATLSELFLVSRTMMEYRLKNG